MLLGAVGLVPWLRGALRNATTLWRAATLIAVSPTLSSFFKEVGLWAGLESESSVLHCTKWGHLPLVSKICRIVSVNRNSYPSIHVLLPYVIRFSWNFWRNWHLGNCASMLSAEDLDVVLEWAGIAPLRFCQKGEELVLYQQDADVIPSWCVSIE